MLRGEAEANRITFPGKIRGSFSAKDGTQTHIPTIFRIVTMLKI